MNVKRVNFIGSINLSSVDNYAVGIIILVLR